MRSQYYVQSKTERFLEAIAEGLITVYQKLGRPPADIKNATFWLMIDQIMQVFTKFYPEEVNDFIHDIKLERSIERSLERSKLMGLKKSIAYPPHLFGLIKSIYPDLIVSDKDFTRKMIGRYPLLNASNYT